jgi:integrase
VSLITTQKAGRPLYIVRWNYRPRSIDGKPYDEKSFRDQREAERWDKKHGKQRQGTHRRLRVADLADLWLDEYVSHHCDASTYDDYEQAVRMRIRPGIGRLVADLITPQQAKAFRDKMLAEGFAHIDHTGRRPRGHDGSKLPTGRSRPARPLTAPMVNKTLRITKALFRWARSEGYTTCTAFEDTRGVKDKRPIVDRRPGPYAYTHDEVEAVVHAAEDLMIATLVKVVVDSGLRRSELFALCWDAVDLDTGTISVVRALDRKGGFKDPKTHERRTVPVLEDGLDALRVWANHAPDHSLVFLTEQGTPLHTTWDSRYLPPLREGSGIRFNLHEGRDTYASQIIAAGATDVEVAIAGGWENVQTVRDHYSVWLDSRKTDIAARANALKRAARK